jgi:plastocyanin
MRTLLWVRHDAPFVTPTAAQGQVLMKGFAFAPKAVQVKAGSKVSWRNADPTEHTVTAKDGSFRSRPLASGKGFVVTFSRPGRFDYFCAIHPTMTGTIRVTG